MTDIVNVLNNPEQFYPGNFDTPERANAFLMSLCQEAAEEIIKLRKKAQNSNNGIKKTISNEKIFSIADKYTGSFYNERHAVFNMDGLIAFADEVIKTYEDNKKLLIDNERISTKLCSWNPISTIPTTGEMVLMWSKYAGFYVGNCPQGYIPGEWHNISGKWSGRAYWRAREATHWAQLPTTPTI